MIFQEQGRQRLRERLETFRQAVASEPRLLDVFTNDWFRMVDGAIADLPLFLSLQSHRPETLPFVEFVNDSGFLGRLGSRVDRLARLPGFSIRRLRNKFASDGPDVLSVLFEINTLSRWSNHILGLEPPFPGSGGSGSSRAEAILRCMHFELLVECRALYFDEMVLRPPAPTDLDRHLRRMTDSIRGKILEKAGQMRRVNIPCVLAISLSSPHQVFMGAPRSPLVDGVNLALADPTSAPISAILIATDHRCDQIVGPFKNLRSTLIPSYVLRELRRPWVPNPDSHPLNEWSPIEAIPD